MKTLIILLLSISTYAQVGINTQEPTRMLDVNGTLRVRVTPNSTSTRIAVIEDDGTIGQRQLPNIPPPLLEDQHAIREYLLQLKSYIDLLLQILSKE